ncbi:hypothetical protein LINPERPRIM_LOCUS20997 [Linum perenne]
MQHACSLSPITVCFYNNSRCTCSCAIVCFMGQSYVYVRTTFLICVSYNQRDMFQQQGSHKQTLSLI